MLRIKRKILLVAFIGLASIAYSQTNTNSPYSRFGIGEMANKGFSINNAMGGIGIGLQKPNTINYLNPASYSSQDTMSFLYDFGMFGQFSSYTMTEGKNVSNTVNFDHLAFAFPITKWMKASLGVKPYSNVGYNIAIPETDIDIIEEMGLVEYHFRGTGNTNNFYFGTALQPFKWLSVGANVMYIFGNIDYKNSIYISSDPNNAWTDINNKNTFGSFYFNFGAQFKFDLNEKNQVILGGVYGPTSNSTFRMHKLVVGNYPTTATGLSTDTIFYEPDLEKTFIFPSTYGLGFSYQYDKKFLIGFDYNKENWSESNFALENQQLHNLESYNLGMEYTPDPDSPKGYFNKINYRAGFYYVNDYLEIKDNRLTKWAVTFGAGIPFKYSKSKINFSAEFGKMGSTDNNMIMERYSMFTFSLTLYDFWFVKRKFN